MREVYMMKILNPTTARVMCALSITDPNKINIKVEDMILLKIIPQWEPLTLNTSSASEFVDDSLTKLSTWKITQEKLDEYLSTIYNYYIWLTRYWPTYLTWLHLDRQWNTLTTPNSCLTYMNQKQKTNIHNVI